MHLLEWQPMNNNDIGVFHVTVMTGVRFPGKTVDNQKNGRSINGFLYVSEGEMCFSQNGCPDLMVGDNSFCLIPQNCRYKMRYTGERTVYTLVDFTLMSSKGEPLLLSDKIEVLFEKNTDPQILRILTKLTHCDLAADHYAAFRKKELFFRLLSVVFEEKMMDSLQRPKYAGIAPGILRLQQTYLENTPISEYAALCNVSLSSFRTLFRECCGQSPVQYRNMLRIKRAEALLSENAYTVSEVARSCGFDNMGYFCRLYKRVIGETPRETQFKYDG